jgi:hypothetical protein
LISGWRRDYNEAQPHGSIDRIPPVEFASLIVFDKMMPEHGDRLGFQPWTLRTSNWCR